MSDEPFLEGFGYASGVPVRYYNGGKESGAASAVPPVGDEGDVLTVDGGVPTWLPPSGGGGGEGPSSGITSTYWFDQAHWLTKNSPFYAVREVPFWAGMAPTAAALMTRGYSIAAELDSDFLVLDTNTGTTVNVVIPATSDGQTFTNSSYIKAGFDVSGYFPSVASGEGVDATSNATPVRWTFRLSWTGGNLPSGAVIQITDGSSTPAAANRYYYVATGDAVTPVTVNVPSGLNTTSTNPDNIHFYCALGASRTWTLEVQRASFDFA